MPDLHNFCLGISVNVQNAITEPHIAQVHPRRKASEQVIVCHCNIDMALGNLILLGVWFGIMSNPENLKALYRSITLQPINVLSCLRKECSISSQIIKEVTSWYPIVR